MKSQELEVDVLRRQNREMAIRMQNYRIENQDLRAKNQELNQWVGNLSEVFSILSASWESITILEETLLNLMKKKTDAKDRTLLRKYQFHFKTFADIINNLSDKIKNPGHSEQATHDAKQQLRSFVKNYELIFKELLDTYFKFNQQYTQFLTDLKNRDDVKEQVRTVVTKGLQNTQKNKEFQAYIESLKQKLHTFEEFNNNKLLEGVVQKKEEEIQALKERNNILERRIKVMFDYNSASVEMKIASQENQIECVCGGAQLAYTKKVWEEKMKGSGENGNDSHKEETKNGPKSQSIEHLEQKLLMVEQEKQNLITRNTLLLQKISKMSTQYKLTDEMVLKSNVYLLLKQQCQELMDYITELMGKLKKNQQYMTLIEKAREEELRELRKKYQKSKTSEEKSIGNNINNHFNNPTDIFKTQITTLIRQLILSFQQLGKKQVKSEQTLKDSKKLFQELKKSNQELNRKVNDLQARELSKTDGPEFKYEKYKELETSVQTLLGKQLPNLVELWKEFIVHVKSRDKKMKDLESVLRKKQKQLTQKTQIQELMQQNINETEKIYCQNKQKLSKTEAFMKKAQTQLIRLADQNKKILSQSEQDKNILTLRLKAETDARNKLDQKISVCSRIEAQLLEVRDNEGKIQKDYELWLSEHKTVLQQSRKQCKQKQLLIKNLTQQSSQTQKTLQKVQTQKQTLKSQIRQLKTRIQAINSSAQNQLLKMELDEYKGKIMCNCTGDREREVVLKTCPHLFCKRCIQDTTNNRNRKCPLCGIRFTKTDVHYIKWN